MLAMIWAQAKGGAIGKDGKLPWHVPEDMALFKRMTMGHAVIMGRKTWESIDPRFRPLPGRRNFVVTRDPDYCAPGAHIARSLEEAYSAAVEATHDLVWLIGGGQLFARAIANELADGAVVTDFNMKVPGATAFAPGVPFSWEALQSNPEHGWNISPTSNVNYRCTIYRRPGSNFAASEALPFAE